MKTKIIIIIVVAIFVMAIAAISLYQSSERAPSSSIFKIVDDPSTFIWEQNIADLGIQNDAVPVFEQRIKDLQTRIAQETDEMVKRDLFNDLGKNYSYLGRYREAFEAYERSLELNYDYRITQMQVGDLMVKMRAYRSAEVAYRKGIEINPYEEQTYLKLADLMKLRNDPTDAILAIYDEGIRIIEGAKQLPVAKADYLGSLGRIDEAIAVLEPLMAIVEDKDGLQNIIDDLKKKQ